jgi:hypothetical protein
MRMPTPLALVLMGASLAALCSGSTTVACPVEGGPAAPPKPAAPGGPPKPPPPEGEGAGEWTPEVVDWIDTDGLVPSEWGWGSKVLLRWEASTIEAPPASECSARIRIANEGSETAQIPWDVESDLPEFWKLEVIYENRVLVPISRGFGCGVDKTPRPLLSGESRTVDVGVLRHFQSRLPGRYDLLLSRPKEGEKKARPSRWRVLPPLRIEMLRATTAELEAAAGKLEKRKSWRDLLFQEWEGWGDLGDARLLGPLEDVLREMEDIMAKDRDGPVKALRLARRSVAKTKVLLALAAGSTEEVLAFLEEKPPKNHLGGHFKAMLRARMEALKSPR